jgi:hypothetical protein
MKAEQKADRSEDGKPRAGLLKRPHSLVAFSQGCPAFLWDCEGKRRTEVLYFSISLSVARAIGAMKRTFLEKYQVNQGEIKI